MFLCHLSKIIPDLHRVKSKNSGQIDLTLTIPAYATCTRERACKGGGGGITLGALSLSMVRARIPFSQKKKDSSLKCDKFFCYGELLIVRCFLHVKNNTSHYLIDISRYGGSEYVHC